MQPPPAHPLPWRTGRHPVNQPGPRGRTLYDANGELIGLMDRPELARFVVEAVNQTSPVQTLPE